MEPRKYYEAYEERYKAAHAQGVRWFGSVCSPIVGQILEKYHILPGMKLLELGCGEGRDACELLSQGYDLLATDISPEAIRYCRDLLPGHAQNFAVLDCVNGYLEGQFDFIYAVAVVHMLLLDEDRDQFYRFIRDHMSYNGIALICSMGDGQTVVQSNIHDAFRLQAREHGGQTLMVAGTSCRMVTSQTFLQEMERNGLVVLESGQTSIPGEFPEMMYAVVRKR